jgi:maleate isomerase
VFATLKRTQSDLGMEEMTKQNIPIQRFPFSMDKGAGWRARIGLLVLESDQTMEDEFKHLVSLPSIAVYHARLANSAVVTPETLQNMEAEIPVAAKLLPEYLALDAIGYGCTSGATVIGEARVAEIIDDVHPNIPSSNPLSAAKAALKALGIKRLGLVTPYSPDVTVAMQSKFNAAGIAVVFVGSFFEESDEFVGRISETSILDAVLSVGTRDEVDGVFVSCTSLRAAGIIPKAEQILNKPVTASNHALAWHLLRLAGIDDASTDKGRLFSLPLGTRM